MKIFHNVPWISLAILCVLSVVFCQSIEEPCTTPGGNPGVCIAIHLCNYLNVTLGTAPQPLNPQQIQLLQSFHCGFQGASPTPKVCCPISPAGGFIPIASLETNNVKINQPNCGGKQPALSQFPWMALLIYNGSSGISFRCSGTLINENYILTAAQCITNLEAKSQYLIGIRIGEYDISTDPDCYNQRGCAPPVQDIGVAEVLPHPGFNSITMEHDIGLIRLNIPANVHSDSVRPVCLPSLDSESSLVGKQAVVTGWGVTETGLMSTRLLKVVLPIHSQSECQSRYSEKNTRVLLKATQICAGGVQGKDACSGDGGGPLGIYADGGVFVQHGIVSFGSRFCGLGDSVLPGVYTNVGKYIPWILNNIRS